MRWHRPESRPSACAEARAVRVRFLSDTHACSTKGEEVNGQQDVTLFSHFAATCAMKTGFHPTYVGFNITQSFQTMFL